VWSLPFPLKTLLAFRGHDNKPIPDGSVKAAELLELELERQFPAEPFSFLGFSSPHDESFPSINVCGSVEIGNNI